ncbi:MAG: 50S ribosomal protein L19 [Candidatus Berkelbacteria bacterium]|nr:50S ribosomal protein L19 [Candidatus Berkelbacteria bacterium]
MKKRKSIKKRASSATKKETKKIFERSEIKPGDTLAVHQKGRSAFSGIVIARHGGNGPSATFVVRSILSGVGVEKIYPLNSPTITKIELIKSAKVRRAKLFYLRKKVGKEATLKAKND